MPINDAQGNVWEEAGENRSQQRLLRCIEGPRAGEIILDPRAEGPPPSQKPARKRMDSFIEALYAPSDMFDD
jgi:hypothetical protein